MMEKRGNNPVWNSGEPIEYQCEACDQISLMVYIAREVYYPPCMACHGGICIPKAIEVTELVGA